MSDGKIFGMPKKCPKTLRRFIIVLNSCVRFALRKAIVWASWQIVSSSSLPRVIIGAIWPFSPHEDNTMETRSFPIVLARQHDYVKPSQCRRVSTVCRRVSTVLYIKIGQSCRRRQPNYPNLRSSSVSLAYITPKASESQFRSCTMAYLGDETDRKKKAAALLLLMQLRENDDKFLQSQHLLLQVKIVLFQSVISCYLPF